MSKDIGGMSTKSESKNALRSLSPEYRPFRNRMNKLSKHSTLEFFLGLKWEITYLTTTFTQIKDEFKY